MPRPASTSPRSASAAGCRLVDGAVLGGTCADGPGCSPLSLHAAGAKTTHGRIFALHVSIATAQCRLHHLAIPGRIILRIDIGDVEWSDPGDLNEGLARRPCGVAHLRA